MPFPTDPLLVTIEFAFGADLKANPNTWAYQDVTADWQPDRALAATIGRADATSKAQPGKLSFTLKNVGGKYTKGNAISPYWPYVRKNTPARVTINPGTGHTRVYQMYVTQWIPRWGSSGDSGRQPLVQVIANGVRRRLTQGSSPLRSPLHRAISVSNPIAWWPLEDGQDSTQAASGTPGGTPMTVNTGIMSFVNDGPAGSAGAAKPAVDADNNLNAVVAGASNTAWQVSVWTRGVRTGTLSASAYYVVAEVRTDNGLIYRFIVQTGSIAAAIALYTSEAASTPANEIDEFDRQGLDGAWHLLQATLIQSGPNALVSFYLDGQLSGSATWAGVTIGKPVRISSIGNFGGGSAVSQNMGEINIAHIAIHNTATLVDQYRAGLGYAGETAGDRIARLCAEEGVAAVVPASVALVSEGFETAASAATITGTWARTSAQFHSGAWSLRSAAIGSSAQTDAVVTVPAGATSMTVWYRVSSESGFDFFRILRDGVLESQFSGEVGWTQRTISVAGISQVTFRYIKDSSTVAGSDAAWIDDLVFTGSPTARMGPQRTSQFVGLLDECQEVDGGILLDGLNPGFTYLARVDAYNLPVAFTVDMAQRQFRAPFEPLDDDANIVNDETVSRTNGSSARYVDAASVAAIERYDDSKTLNVYQDSDLPGQASWRTHLGTAGTDGYRFPGVGFDLYTPAGSALIEPWLTSGVRKRVRVTNPPMEYGAGPIDLLVEGYTETVRSRRVWSVAANASQYAHDVFVVGADRVDGDGYQLAAGVSATATTLQVASTTGLLWITTAADPTAFPFDLDIAGIRVRVTGISGTASPQTFTVQRSMDGFDKTLPTATPVRLWKPAVIGL